MTLWGALATLGLALMIAGCGPIDDSAAPAVEVTGFGGVMAVGSTRHLTVRVRQSPAAVESISVLPETDAIEVESSTAHNFKVRAHEAGKTALEVIAHMDDQTNVRTTVELESADPARLTLEHRCPGRIRGVDHPTYTEGDEYAAQPYLTDSTATIEMEVYDESGRALSIEGFVAFDWEPAGALELVQSTSKSFSTVLEFETGSQAQEVALQSTFDDTQLRLNVVEVGGVNRLSTLEESLHELFDFSALRVTDGTLAVHMLPGVDDNLICNHDIEISFQSLTPQVCQTGAIDAFPEPINLLPNWPEPQFGLALVGPGTCELQAHAPDAADGQGVDWEYSLEVVRSDDER
jgi:hypothetical protein